jgi:hypothetical protein
VKPTNHSLPVHVLCDAASLSPFHVRVCAQRHTYCYNKIGATQPYYGCTCQAMTPQLCDPDEYQCAAVLPTYTCIRMFMSLPFSSQHLFFAFVTDMTLFIAI